MKSQFPLESPDRFSGRMRHYHRAGGQKQRTWDEWVSGSSKAPVVLIPWTKIILTIAGLLVLGGIAAGLILELG